MKRDFFWIPAFILCGFLFSAVVLGQSPFTPAGQRWEPCPAGHLPGKDNGSLSGVTGTDGTHFSGADCGICHAPGKKAESFAFTVAGTIFKDKAGREPLSGAEVILMDVTGNVVSMTSNSAGNFFTYAPIAHDPVAGADPTKPYNWRYKAWVKHGETVGAMVTIAPVGSSAATTPRMSCNMHHAGLGPRGALTAGKFDTLPEYPETEISFRSHVLPILKNRCKACHLPASASPFVSYAGERFDYSGGLDLSAYDRDENSRSGVPDVAEGGNPDQSQLLIRPMAGSVHSGSAFWEPGDIEYEVIRQWIVEGALNN